MSSWAQHESSVRKASGDEITPLGVLHKWILNAPDLHGMFCNSKLPIQMHFLFNTGKCTSIKCKDLKTERNVWLAWSREEESIEVGSEKCGHGRKRRKIKKKMNPKDNIHIVCVCVCVCVCLQNHKSNVCIFLLVNTDTPPGNFNFYWKIKQNVKQYIIQQRNGKSVYLLQIKNSVFLQKLRHVSRVDNGHQLSPPGLNLWPWKYR